MSTRKRITPFPPWQTSKIDGKEERYIRLGNSQLLSQAMLSLHHTAFHLYVYMLLESGGKREFEFPHRKYTKICSKGGFERAVEELEVRGFIDVVQHNKNRRIANIYSFSERWKNFRLTAEQERN